MITRWIMLRSLWISGKVSSDQALITCLIIHSIDRHKSEIRSTVTLTRIKNLMYDCISLPCIIYNSFFFFSEVTLKEINSFKPPPTGPIPKETSL